MNASWKRTHRLGRRRFLQATAAGIVYGALTKPLAASSIYLPTLRRDAPLDILPAAERVHASAATYRVGVGRNSSAYTATLRALDASAELTPAQVAGRTVLIKPNLVVGKTAETGVTTDPEVVRALVDRVLAAGAAAVKIIEGFAANNLFDVCGYTFFDSYDPQGRVSLVDLRAEPVRLVDVPQGTAYRHIYLPELLLDPNSYLISAAKLKCHSESVASLSVKNNFGLPPEATYRLPQPGAVGRFAMHHRGMHQTVLDLNSIRPIDFAVVDGVWGLEGMGPARGVPVRMDAVVAGKNAVAVDRICLALMQIPPERVLHLSYAGFRGLGPTSLLSVTARGDAVTPKQFRLPPTPPLITYPSASPLTFSPAQNQQTTISFILDRAAPTRVEIVQVSETATEVTRIRLLQDWAAHPAGMQSVTWDGRGDDGALAPPGIYKARVEASADLAVINSFASGWVGIS